MVRGKQIAQESGKGLGNSLWAAMREFGYEGPKDEWNKYWDWAEQERDKLQREKEKVKAEKRALEWEQALAELPPNAPVATELNWIRAHPAMTRKARDPKNEHVILKAEDLLGCEHGDCPSQAAAQQLQWWVNDPKEFFKNILSEHKKKSESGEASSEVVEDAGADEIERMLADLRSSGKN